MGQCDVRRLALSDVQWPPSIVWRLDVEGSEYRPGRLESLSGVGAPGGGERPDEAILPTAPHVRHNIGGVKSSIPDQGGGFLQDTFESPRDPSRRGGGLPRPRGLSNSESVSSSDDDDPRCLTNS